MAKDTVRVRPKLGLGIYAGASVEYEKSKFPSNMYRAVIELLRLRIRLIPHQLHHLRALDVPTCLPPVNGLAIRVDLVDER